MRYFVYTRGGDGDKNFMGAEFVDTEDIENMLGDWLDCEWPEKEEVKKLVSEGAEGDWQRYIDEYPKVGDLFPCLLGSSSYMNKDIFIFEDTFIEPCLDKLVDTFDGGYPGEWMELVCDNGGIKIV